MDVYVLGSGPTVTFVDPAFFDGKTVIATNGAGERLGLYGRDVDVRTHSHYHEETYRLAGQHPGHEFWTPQGDQGHAGAPGRTDLPNVHHYPHQPTRYDFDVDAAWPLDGGLLVGSTSLHGSMHLACELGAGTVILVGADCGLLDDRANQAGYDSGNLLTSDRLAWLARWESHLRAVADRLRAVYGVRIYSLLPFVNANMEGREWTGVYRRCRVCGSSHCADLHGEAS